MGSLRNCSSVDTGLCAVQCLVMVGERWGVETQYIKARTLQKSVQLRAEEKPHRFTS